VADRVYTETEGEICYAMDKALISMGLARKPSDGVECHGLSYYRSEKAINSKGVYSFRLISRGFDFEVIENETKKMRLFLRIRNVSNCLEYMESCPDSIKRIFTEYSDESCRKRRGGTCIHGVSYVIGKKQYWRCGCCNAAFYLKPNQNDISHYIKLVELGEKK